jgi:hypothetical protein
MKVGSIIVAGVEVLYEEGSCLTRISTRPQGYEAGVGQIC